MITLPSRLRRAAPTSLTVLGLICLASSCFVLLDLFQLAFTGTVVDAAGRSSWTLFAGRILAIAAGVTCLWAAAAIRRREGGRAPTAEPAFPAPCPAPAPVRRLAHAACLAFLPYLTLHGLHAFGLAPWLDHLYVDGGAGPAGLDTLEFVLFAATVVGSAWLLLLGLVHSWGMALPRWLPLVGRRRVSRYLPLVPVVLVAPTLALYGTGSMVYGIVTSPEEVVGLGGAASLAFGTYGWALAVAAISYEKRTRPL